MELSPKQRTAKPKPDRPWQRAEAGSYRSSDERFTIESEGPSRWFFIDEEQRDELGLARTTGPFPTLDAAKAAADEHRERAPEASPLADRIATAGTTASKGADKRRGAGAADTKAQATSEPEPRPPPKTWLDKLEDEDHDAARAARRLIATLEKEGIDRADDLVRRDVIGDQPAVAARLLAREILSAVADATSRAALERRAKGLPASSRDEAMPQLVATAAIDAVVEVLTSSRRKRGLPGWKLVERDGPTSEPRVIRLTDDDLRAAAAD